MASFDPITEELWYPIPGFDGYEFSSDFRFRSFRQSGTGKVVGRSRPITARPNRRGYLYVTLRRANHPYVVFIHRLVAELAYGPAPEGALVLHADDDQTNNHAFNLRYGTLLQNSADARRNGKLHVGERGSKAKLNASQVLQIRARVAAGESQRRLAVEFGVCRSAVGSIVGRRSWAHVS